MRARLFHPFERLGAERSTIEGASLGLTLSKQLVEAMNGNLIVESTPGGGSTFWIELERVKAQESAIIRINAGGPELELNGKLWLEDRYYTGGTHFVAPAEMAIANTERFATEDLGTFRYDIPVPSDGRYLVLLHFAEIYFGAPGGGPGEAGRRVFDVILEGGQARFEAIDLVAKVGPTTASVHPVELEVTGGVLELDFRASADRPKLSGVEVFLLEPAPTVIPPEALPELVRSPFEPRAPEVALRGSVALREAGAQGASLVVSAFGLEPEEIYQAQLVSGPCEAGDVRAEWPIHGRSGLGSVIVPQPFGNLLAGDYTVALRTQDGSLLACAALQASALD